MNPNNNKSSLNLWLDILLLLALLMVYEHHATGIIIHEWLGISIGLVSIVHILLHWKWITCVTRKFFTKMASEHRLKYILNVFIFISFSTILFAGLMMSRSVLPFLGIKVAETPFWRWLHFTSVDITVWLVAIHIALNWRWILNAFKQYILNPVRQLTARNPVSQLVQSQIVSERKRNCRESSGTRGNLPGKARQAPRGKAERLQSERERRQESRSPPDRGPPGARACAWPP